LVLLSACYWRPEAVVPQGRAETALVQASFALSGEPL